MTKSLGLEVELRISPNFNNFLNNYSNDLGGRHEAAESTKTRAVGPGLASEFGAIFQEQLVITNISRNCDI